MKPDRRSFLVFPFLLFLLVVATAHSDEGTGDYLERMGVSRMKENTDAPHFVLPDLNERKRNLGEFKGKFVMLNFWTTW